MRVIAFAPYPEEAPSTRFRLAQFRQPLGERGIELEIDPFVRGDEYAHAYGLGHLTRRARLLARMYGRRWESIGRAAEVDAVIVHRELSPVVHVPMLQRLRRTGVPFIFDFDDAIFIPAAGSNPLLKPLRRPRNTTASLCRGAACVLAGNEYLADFARQVRGDDAPGVKVIPTVVDTDRFRPASEIEDRDVPVIGWTGTHTTTSYLVSLYPVLARLRERVEFRLLVVSNRAPPPLPGVEVQFVPWSPDNEVSCYGAIDIGVYPLSADTWTLGKCGFKAIQYLSCGVPAVGSRVGAIREVIVHGETGFLADTDDEWLGSLETLIRDRSLRRRMGERGRTSMLQRYSVEAVIDSLAGTLRGLNR